MNMTALKIATLILVPAAILMAIGITLGVTLSNRDTSSSSADSTGKFELPAAIETDQNSTTANPELLMKEKRRNSCGRPGVVALHKNKHTTPCCGGVLLSTGRHVLTAAHCVDNCGGDPASLTVRLCGYDSTTDEVRHQDYAVQSVRKHDGFVYEDTGKHDIALLVLVKSVHFNDDVKPASLSQTDEPYDSQEAIVTAYGGTRPLLLEEVPVRVWSSEKCRSVVDSEKRHSVLDNFLCTSSYDSRTRVEKRHAGGPLQVRTPSGEWEVVGIVSFGSNKHRRSPVVYVKVFKYLHWINQNIKGDFKGDERESHPMGFIEGNSRVPRSWPWMAALLRNGHSAPCCSGVLLSDGHVLTAAHCVDERGVCGSNTASLTVRLGGYDNTTDEVRYQDYAVLSVMKHEDFLYKNTGKHDIAILELQKNVHSKDYVQPASLSQADEPYDSQEAIVTGYKNIINTRLEEAPVRVWSSEECHGVVDSEKRHSVLDNFLCTSTKDSRKRVEKGYAGGPLQVRTLSGEWEVVGIVSYGNNFRPRSPVVNVKVFKYLQWINQKIQNSAHDNLADLMSDSV